ncbi:GNAT family N-acetyltransferase [Ignatzschineria rhizosphaerae]|uniref:GNAT family N-acetyltransferase n=1 Tax=Ignatzschineria rhizosphaerae TaxID=2923279 RepID=A0ABY3X4S3_9GAMM|nr:GNAT family N-acetyltransferase [Ignatzschineria rhizosphaerae]UNM95746.1 GNAT family N-acetyltransferase [Ignatzschineria rhizosphaerae]
MHQPKLHCAPFSNLSIDQLYQILQLRSKVFVVEQNCPYLDIDSQDQEAIHLWFEDKSQAITTYLRILPKTATRKNVMIGRVVVHHDFRGQGLSRTLLLEAFLWITKNLGEEPIEISAQAYLLEFYQSLGFKQTSEIYLEDNIPHLDMLKTDY